MPAKVCINVVLLAATVCSQSPLADQYGYQSPDGSRTTPDGVTVPYYPGVPTPPPAVKYTSPLTPPSSTDTDYRQNGGIDGPYAIGNPNYVYPPPPVPVPGVVIDANGNVIACSRDVTRCADGTYVGRNRENGCQFFNCPTGYWPGYSDGYSPPATASPPPSVFQPPPVPASPQVGYQPPYVATPQPNPWNRTPKPFVWQTPQPTLRGITPPVPIPTNGQLPPTPPTVPFVPPPTPFGNGGGNVPWNPPPTPQPTQWGSGQFVPPPPRTPEPQGLPVFSPVLTQPGTPNPPPAAVLQSNNDDDDDGKTAFVIGMCLIVVLILIAIFAAIYLCMKAKADKKKAARKQAAEREERVAKAVTGITPPPPTKSLVHHPQFNYPYNNYPVAEPGSQHPPPYY